MRNLFSWKLILEKDFIYYNRFYILQQSVMLTYCLCFHRFCSKWVNLCCSYIYYLPAWLKKNRVQNLNVVLDSSTRYLGQKWGLYFTLETSHLDIYELEDRKNVLLWSIKYKRYAYFAKTAFEILTLSRIRTSKIDATTLEDKR